MQLWTVFFVFQGFCIRAYLRVSVEILFEGFCVRSYLRVFLFEGFCIRSYLRDPVNNLFRIWSGQIIFRVVGAQSQVVKV
jgi:hypothetical protein